MIPRLTVPTLAEAWCRSADGAASRVRQAALVVAAVLLLTAAAHVRVPMWPVPVTMQTFAVLMIGAACGPVLAAGSLLAYLALGALGVSVFAGNGMAQGGISYMLGPTGGYLVGFAFAAVAVGWIARRGWDRSVPKMAIAFLAANAIIYLFGLSWMAWLFAAEKGMGWVFQWGMLNFLPGDLLKLALAAVLMPFLRAVTSRSN